ncbi:MAG: MGMT family protein [Acidimicrobiales bacterium]|jgi:alkylated DNA nucleotide flippase Atl1
MPEPSLTHVQPTPSRFAPAVRRVIGDLQPGEVVTYGEMAREAGYDGAARAVGTLLAREGSDLPWWRVVTSTGRLVPGQEREHARRLRAEGVELAGTPLRVRRRPSRAAQHGDAPTAASGLTGVSRRKNR